MRLRVLLPALRRLVQGFVLSVLLLSPLFQLVRTYHQNPYPYPRSPVVRSESAASFLTRYDRRLRRRLQPLYDNVSGGPYSLKLFPFIFAEPLTVAVHAVGSLAHPRSWNAVFLFTFAVAMGLALFLGRVYCGYVCPMSLLSSLNQRLQRRLFGRRLRGQPPVSAPLRRGRLLYIALLFIVIGTNPMVLQYLLPPALVQHAVSDFVLWGGWTVWGVLVLGVVGYDIVRPGHFCRYLCPTGIFLSYVGRRRMVRLHHVSGTSCPKECTVCMHSCWLGLAPKTWIVDPRCDLCLRCLEGCPSQRIGLKASVAAALLLLLVAVPSGRAVAEGHHGGETYYEELSVKTYYEGQTVVRGEDGSAYEIYYAVAGRTSREYAPGRLTFYVHIRESGHIFDDPLDIAMYSRARLQAVESFSTVTDPISIRRRSTYALEFHYRPYETYRFVIRSPQGRFPPVEVSFRYPPLRF